MLQEGGRAFSSKPRVDVDPKCLLYVQQREFAATTPADSEWNKVLVINHTVISDLTLNKSWWLCYVVSCLLQTVCQWSDQTMPPLVTWLYFDILVNNLSPSPLLSLLLSFFCTFMTWWNHFISWSGSGAVCLAHCDGFNTWNEVRLLVNAVTLLSKTSEDGRCETCSRSQKK